MSANSLEAALAALKASVEFGVHGDGGGVYRFLDPGLSLVTMHRLATSDTFYRQWYWAWKRSFSQYAWYEQHAWGQEDAAPKERILIAPVPTSYGKSFRYQNGLLTPGRNVASVRSLASLVLIHYLQTGKPLYSGWLRCADYKDRYSPVIVGLASNGVDINPHCEEMTGCPVVGVAAEMRGW